MLADNKLPHSTEGSRLLKRLPEEEMWRLAQEVVEGSAELLDIDDVQDDPTYLLFTMFLGEVDKTRLKDAGRIYPLGRGIDGELSEEGWPLATSIQFLTSDEVEAVKEKADRMSKALSN